MPGNPLSDPNWASTAADTIERVVTSVREKSTDKIVVLARALVFGIVAVIGGLVALVLVLVIATRGLQALLDLVVEHPTSVWVSYLALGGILCLGGAFSMSKRRSADD